MIVHWWTLILSFKRIQLDARRSPNAKWAAKISSAKFGWNRDDFEFWNWKEPIFLVVRRTKPLNVERKSNKIEYFKRFKSQICKNVSKFKTLKVNKFRTKQKDDVNRERLENSVTRKIDPVKNLQEIDQDENSRDDILSKHKKLISKHSLISKKNYYFPTWSNHKFSQNFLSFCQFKSDENSQQQQSLENIINGKLN